MPCSGFVSSDAAWRIRAECRPIGSDLGIGPPVDPLYAPGLEIIDPCLDLGVVLEARQLHQVHPCARVEVDPPIAEIDVSRCMGMSENGDARPASGGEMLIDERAIFL